MATRERRLKADYAKPARVLEALAEILDGRCMWGSDNPYMSWCADSLRVIYSYTEEAAVLADLPAEVKTSVASAAPEAWLFGKRQAEIPVP